MTETATVPEWLHVGATVALHTVGNVAGRRVTTATVTKIGKRDVVLDNGSRFNVNHLSRSLGQWSPTVYLRPLDDEAVQRDAMRDRRQNTAAKVEELARQMRSADDDACGREAHRILGRYLGLSTS